MKNCKKHQNCQFEGKGKHNGCYMHGIIDGCTNERQQLFKDGHLAYALNTPKQLTQEEWETYEKRQHELAVARVSASGGGGMFAGIIIGLILGILITFLI